MRPSPWRGEIVSGLAGWLTRGRRAARVDRLILQTERKALLRLGALTNAPIQELFDAISQELSHIVDIETGETFQDMAGVSRYDPDGFMTFVSGYGPRPDWPSPVGSRWPLQVEGDSTNAIVYRTGKPARKDGTVPVVGPTSHRLTEVLGIKSTVAVPIYVDNALWGSATIVSPRDKPLPPNTEARMLEFAALAATSISSAQRREQAERLADEQAALRRVATVVATGVEPEQVWGSVVAEVGALCNAIRTHMIRYDEADSMSVVASWAADGEPEELAERWPLVGNGLSARVRRERTVVRIDDWSTVEGPAAAAVRERMPVGTSVMAPVFVQGDIWGGIAVHSGKDEKLPPGTGQQLAGFAELVSTALANATARLEVRRLADEQATIRRIATLVAQQSAVEVICQTVAEEFAALLAVEDVKVCRFDGDDKLVVVGSWGLLDEFYPVGFTTAVSTDTALGQVHRDGRTVRVESYQGSANANAQKAHGANIRSTIAFPIFLGDRLWGGLTVSSPQPGRIPERVTQPIRDCIDLVATAVLNAEAEENLRASRERIVTAADEARRRFERDLHDGAQQRLVALALELRATDSFSGAAVLTTADEVDSILTDLRDLSRGLHPAVLTEGGLATAIRSLVRRCPARVRLSFPDDWPGLDDLIEIACYHFIAEALANVARHAGAQVVDVEVAFDTTTIRMTVTDDGAGGADIAGGSGLLGIVDRMEALGGSLSVKSPRGAGTTLVATLPIKSPRG